jgi:hypothetical protein
MRRGVTGHVWLTQANTDKIALYLPTRGAIAQLGERIVRNDEVVGSIPTSSTNLLKRLPSLNCLRKNLTYAAVKARQSHYT